MADGKTRIDEKDITIIMCLLKNSRTSFREIAEECKVSTLTIKNRYNRLKKAGIIKGSTVIVNLWEFGIEAMLVSLITVGRWQVKQSIKNLQGSLEDKTRNIICYPIKFNERYNIVFTVPVKSIAEIQEVREMLKKQPQVMNIETNIWTTAKNFPHNLDLQPVR